MTLNKGEKGHILINWDGGSIERNLIENRLDTSPTAVRSALDEIVDEHAAAGVDSYVHVVFFQFRPLLPDSKVLEVPSLTPAVTAAGVDHTRVLMDRCHEHGMKFIACLRMNDRHGNSVEARVWKQHPQWRLDQFKGGLDYKHEGVRAKVLEFIAELLETYDVDGIEFDYLRWAHMFRTDEAEQHAPLLTDLTAQARKLLDQAASRRGVDRLRLGVRVPQTLEECRGLGYDVAAWISGGLVDYVVPSDFFFTDIETRVEDFVALADGHDCRIYPAIHPIIARGNDHQLMNLANYRAAAHNFYARGADGLSPYNYMYAWDKRRDVSYVGSGLLWPGAVGYLRELADAERVRSGDRHYLFHALWVNGAPTGFENDGRIIVERTATDLQGSRRFRVCDDLSDANLRAVLQFKAAGMREDETLRIRLNGGDVRDDQITRLFDAEGQTEYEGRELPAFFLYHIDLPRGAAKPMIANGDNELSVQLVTDNGKSGGQVIIDELEAYVHVGGG